MTLRSALTGLGVVLFGAAAALLGMWIAAPPEAPAGKSGGSPAPAAHDHGQMTAEAEEGEAAAETLWTCSMHPAVQLPEAGQCPICGMDLIPMEASTGGDGPPRVTLSPQARALARIQTVEVEHRPLIRRLRLVGKVAWDERRIARVTAWFGGRIERLYVDYTGATVKQGDHLLRIYSPELLVAQQELLQADRAARRAPAGSPLETGAQERLDATRQKLRLWGLREWQIQRVLDKKKPEERVTIYSPIHGLVIEKAAVEGAWVQTGTPIATIADPSHVWVNLDAQESEIQWLRYGQEVDFEVAAWPGRPFRGTITFISPTMDPKTRSVRVRVHVDNEDLRLKPDMYVTARVQVPVTARGMVPASQLAGKWVSPMHPEVVADKPGRCSVCGMKLVPAEEHWLVGPMLKREGDAGDPLVIPESAPLVTGKRAVVFVEQDGAEEPTYVLRDVRLGPRAEGYYVVLDGLMAGERVVSEGAFKLDSALQIRGDVSVMKRAPGTTGAATASRGGDGADGSAPDRIVAVQDGLRGLAGASNTGDAPAAAEAAARLARAVEGAHQAGLLRGATRWLVAAEKPDARAAALALVFQTAPRVAGLEDIPPATWTAPKLTPAWTKRLGAVVEASSAVSAALAADDAQAARRLAAPLSKAAKALATGSLPVDPTIAQAADKLAREPADLPVQRETYERFSEALVPLVLAWGEGLPVQHQAVWCPMAFDDRGAGWIQGPGDITNPWFGASMLGCGTVEESR